MTFSSEQLHRNLALAVLENSESVPDHVALIYNNKQWTYGQLATLIRRRASQLYQLGITKGQPVGLLFYNTVHYVVNFFALLSVGAVVLPINVRLTAHEMSKMVAHSQLVAILSDPDFADVLALLSQLQPQLQVIQPKNFRQPAPKIDQNLFPVDVDGQTLATLVYTSGTTGEPKGVMLSHANIWADVLANIDVIEGQATDRFITVSPLFHVFGQTNVMVTAMALGASLVLMEKFSPRTLLELIETHGVTVLTAVPTMYQLLLIHLRDKQYDLSSVRVCHSGAAAMPTIWITDIETAFEAPVQEGYGLSEATSIVCSNPLHGPRKPGTVGPAISGVRLAIWDADNQPLPPDTVGEIVLQGDVVMLGYYQNPEATVQKIVNGWLKTGDLGFLDTDGYLTIVNRKDDLINVGGVNVYPKEIEAVLREHPAIADVAVTGRPSHLYHQEVWAFLVHDPAQPKPSNEALFQFCQPYLAAFKIPKHFEWREELPKTASGKIQRNKL